MPGLRLIHKNRHTLWVAIGLLCCALIALTGMVQVAHTHADGRVAQSDCVLCHTAHVVAQVPIAQFLLLAVWVVTPLAALPQPVRRQRFLAFPLFTRPPPADVAFS